jgi:peptide/nickel transport system substrate-binding protein
LNLSFQDTWEGDWTKGHAGGYGTDETDWRGQYDIWENKAGMIAESTKWTIDAAKKEGTIVYTVRKGIHWALNPISPMSVKVNGRELTADDFAAYLTRTITDSRAYLWKTNIPLRQAVVTKTGPWEVAVKVPLDTLITAIFRFGDACKIAPVELKDSPMVDWKDVSFGTGPYMTIDYVAGSTATQIRNPNYWIKNPIGPGKGDQLPYIDKVKHILITDASTRQAAFRTGKIDTILYELEDANTLRKQIPGMPEAPTGEPTKPAALPESIDFPNDQDPFKDIRVRQALFMATDLKTINKTLFAGLGVLESWPWQGVKGYEQLRVGINDPDTPAAIKELYTYNPDKAKQLLKDAGFPSGFKTKAVMITDYVDFWSIIKEQWAKVGVDLSMDVMESTARRNLLNSNTYKGLTDGGVASDCAFHTTPTLTGGVSADANTVHLSDPKVDEALASIRMTILNSGMKAGMKEARELVKYVVGQAYAIPVPYLYKYQFWWPWLKGYTGESSVGYYNMYNWPQYVWVDQDLKHSMGY